MKMRNAVILAILLAASVVGAPDVSQERIEIGGQKHNYYVYAPKAVQDRSRAPMLVLLHGAGRDGLSLIDPWKDLAAQEGIILVAPNAANGRMWQLKVDGPEPLTAMSDAVRRKYRADANRVYLFGHSAGAAFSLYMAFQAPDVFAAIAVHAGDVQPTAEKDIVGPLKAVVRKTPILVQVGSDDPYFPPAAVRRTQALFQAAAFPFEVKEIPHHDHDYYAISADVNRDAWAFLKDKTLSPASK